MHETQLGAADLSRARLTSPLRYGPNLDGHADQESEHIWARSRRLGVERPMPAIGKKPRISLFPAEVGTMHGVMDSIGYLNQLIVRRWPR